MVAIVYTAAAQMPSTCKGQYRNVHVIDVAPELARKASKQHFTDKRWGPRYRDTFGPSATKWRPPSITSKQVRKVLRSWFKCNVGLTERCAYVVAVKEAEEFCAKYNKEQTTMQRMVDYQRSHRGGPEYD